MIKKTVKGFALLALAAVATASGWAAPVKIGDLYYNLKTTPYAEEEGTLEAEVTTSTGKIVWTPDVYAGDYDIPDFISYEGTRYAVTAIGNNAFASQTEVTSIKLPETVRTLGSYAFSDTKISEITFPKNVEKIGLGVISRANSLKALTCEAVTPPTLDGVAFIGAWQDEITLYVPAGSVEAYSAATGWKSFKEILVIVEQQVLPESITLTPDSFTGYIGSRFSVSATVLPENADEKRVVYSSSDPQIATVDENGNVVLLSEGVCDIIATSYAVPEVTGVCRVNSEEDRRVFPTQIVFSPEGVNLPVGAEFDIEYKVLPEDAFDKKVLFVSHNTDVATVDENGHVEIVGSGNAFITIMCDINHQVGGSLSVIAREPFRTENGIKYQLYPKTYTADVIGVEGDYPSDLTVPQDFLGGFSDYARYTVTGIGEDAFLNNSVITSVSLPATVERIGMRAFSKCSKLTSFVVPERVDTIPGGAFAGSALRFIVIPDGVTVIDNQAFKDCSDLESVEIGSGLEMLYLMVFQGCTSLSDIRISAATPPEFFKAAAPGVSLEPFPEEIYTTCRLEVPSASLPAYQQADIWKKFENIITFTPAVEAEIGGFRYNLYDDTLTATVIASGEYSGEIDIPATVALEGKEYTVDRIGKRAFAGSNIDIVRMPAGVKHIEAEAFADCPSLIVVGLPDYLESIGEKAFFGCPLIRYIRSYNMGNSDHEPPTFATSTDDNTGYGQAFSTDIWPDCTLCIPADMFMNYKGAAGWKNFRKWAYWHSYDVEVEEVSLEGALVGAPGDVLRLRPGVSPANATVIKTIITLGGSDVISVSSAQDEQGATVYDVKLLKEGTATLNFYCNLVKTSVKIECSENGAVEVIGIDAEAPRYFNLQGVEITNPERGQLLIERRGDKTRKIIF